jgi:hypothetical protein
MSNRDALEGVKRGTLFHGTLRMNKRRRQYAYVIVDNMVIDMVVIGGRYF